MRILYIENLSQGQRPETRDIWQQNGAGYYYPKSCNIFGYTRIRGALDAIKRVGEPPRELAQVRVGGKETRDEIKNGLLSRALSAWAAPFFSVP